MSIIGESTVIKFKVVDGDLEAFVSHDGIKWQSDGFRVTLRTLDGLQVQASMPMQRNRRWKKGERFRGAEKLNELPPPSGEPDRG